MDVTPPPAFAYRRSIFQVCQEVSDKGLRVSVQDVECLMEASETREFVESEMHVRQSRLRRHGNLSSSL